jgi:hypothetical protein
VRLARWSILAFVTCLAGVAHADGGEPQPGLARGPEWASAPAPAPRSIDLAFDAAPCDRPDGYPERCDVDEGGGGGIRSPGMVVAGGVLITLGTLGLAGGAALIDEADEGSSSSSAGFGCSTDDFECRADARGGGDAKEFLFTAAGGGTMVMGGIVMLVGVPLLVVGILPAGDGDERDTASLQVRPTGAELDVRF